MTSPLEDRRQRAREAYWDAYSDEADPGLQDAIETATRVRITDEADRAFLATYHEATALLSLSDARKRGIAAALRELGFEVEE